MYVRPEFIVHSTHAVSCRLFAKMFAVYFDRINLPKEYEFH